MGSYQVDGIPKEVLDTAIGVLGSLNSAELWLRSPNQRLNGQSPLERLCQPDGYEIVLELLGRIEHGIFS